MRLSDCSGCHDNFYNGNNPLGVNRCWNFEAKKKPVTKFRLHINTAMNQKGGYRKVKIPPCFHMDRHIHVEKIPDYAK